MRCKLTGHDLDPCGICTRCGDASEAKHDWQDVERKRPCYRRRVCSRCNDFKEDPDHDWTPTPVETGDGTGVELRCSRCALKI